MKKIIMPLFVGIGVLLTFAPLSALTLPLVNTSTCYRGGSTTLTGESWTFFVDPSNAGASGPHTVTFSQSGCTFKSVGGTSNGYRIYGSIYGNQVDFTYVVDGEEAEGYVLQAKGYLRGTTNAANNVLVAVYTDSNNVTGSFTAAR
jgi:hypothetical protein